MMKIIQTVVFLIVLGISFFSTNVYADKDWRLAVFDEAQSINKKFRAKDKDKFLSLRPELRDYLELRQKWNDTTDKMERRVFVFKLEQGYAIQAWTSPWSILNSINSTEELKQLVDKDSVIKDLYRKHIKLKAACKKAFPEKGRLCNILRDTYRDEFMELDQQHHQALAAIYEKISDRIHV